jgi:hypothetical protein
MFSKNLKIILRCNKKTLPRGGFLKFIEDNA